MNVHKIQLAAGQNVLLLDQFLDPILLEELFLLFDSFQ
jgi:hypothetical protein